MDLPTIHRWLRDQARQHPVVVRLQTGDPALYGALPELAHPLLQADIPVRVVPGVSSAMAAAATATESLTLPEVTQTVIFTRMAGRTPMPDTEQLVALARHRCTLCLFLSAGLADHVRTALLDAGWPNDAPVLAVHRASWPDEQVEHTRLDQLPDLFPVTLPPRQTMIIVSPALRAATQTHGAPLSRLYAPDFSHGCRTETNK
jgi:precorrin-4/cobalt-precorrin-4 C11-methyltransferase